MFSVKSGFVAVVAGSALAFVSVASADDVIANGGFELGAGTNADNWQQVGTQAPLRDNTMPRPGGDWALKFEAVGAAGIGANSVAVQNSIEDGGLPSLQENTTVDVSFWAKGTLGPGGAARAFARLLDGMGNIIVTETVELTPVLTSSYEQYTFNQINVPAFGPDPTDEYAIFVEIVAEAGGFVGSNATVFIDDVVATGTLVPEPAALALLGAAGLTLLARRRRA